MKDKITGSTKIDSAIKALLHESSNLYRTVLFFFNEPKNGREQKTVIKTVLLETINLRNSTFAAVPGEVSSEGSEMFRHQSLSSNKYAPSNFRKEFAFRLSRCRGLTTVPRHGDSWISDIAGSGEWPLTRTIRSPSESTKPAARRKAQSAGTPG